VNIESDPRYQRALKAYRDAWEKAKEQGDEMLDALEKRDLVSTDSAWELFDRKAKRALVAAENWRKASEKAREILQDIASGITDVPG
jgi:hypothetical protein